MNAAFDDMDMDMDFVKSLAKPKVALFDAETFEANRKLRAALAQLLQHLAAFSTASATPGTSDVQQFAKMMDCLLYTSDAADDM
eukprot:5537742-Alexandrium_andersonii.AAC.1